MSSSIANHPRVRGHRFRWENRRRAGRCRQAGCDRCSLPRAPTSNRKPRCCGPPGVLVTKPGPNGDGDNDGGDQETVHRGRVAGLDRAAVVIGERSRPGRRCRKPPPSIGRACSPRRWCRSAARHRGRRWHANCTPRCATCRRRIGWSSCCSWRAGSCRMQRSCGAPPRPISPIRARRRPPGWRTRPSRRGRNCCGG